jgi:hypothetical protein
MFGVVLNELMRRYGIKKDDIEFVGDINKKVENA